jgi:predicted RNase H-like HicB family nuclease
MSNIQINIKFPVKIEKKEKWYVSSCPVVDIYSQGNTEEEANSNIIEALTIFLTSCIEHGTLEAVLKDCGIKLTSILPVNQDISESENYVILSTGINVTLLPSEDKSQLRPCRVYNSIDETILIS